MKTCRFLFSTLCLCPPITIVLSHQLNYFVPSIQCFCTLNTMFLSSYLIVFVLLSQCFVGLFHWSCLLNTLNSFIEKIS